MQKIPTVFLRDPKNLKLVTDQVNPVCQWVLTGEGVATRKWDGTCVMFDGDRWWARREVKAGKNAPTDFQALSTDEVTEKTVGWEPIEASGFAKFHADALDKAGPRTYRATTYELVGPKINGDPERVGFHSLVPHDETEAVECGRTYGEMQQRFVVLAARGWEGLVWHHPDGRMAKLKVRDFPSA